jgi:hypothetical protein
MNKLIKIFLNSILIVIFISKCESSSNTSSTNALALSALTYPIITSVEPNQIYSTFTLEGIVYPAASIKILGRNFSAVLADNVVSFNGIIGTIVSATASEITATVPEGVSSGVLTVSKNGGSCNSLDKKSGINCGGTDVYVNCYSAFKSTYGSEILLKFGSQNSVEFTESLGTKAFRVDLPEGNRTLLLNCPSEMTVTVFSKTCSPTKTTSIVPSVTNPQIQVTGGYTMQFFVTTQSGSCTISIF